MTPAGKPLRPVRNIRLCSGLFENSLAALFHLSRQLVWYLMGAPGHRCRPPCGPKPCIRLVGLPVAALGAAGGIGATKEANHAVHHGGAIMLVVADLAGWLALANGSRGASSNIPLFDIFPTWNLPFWRSSTNVRVPISTAVFDDGERVATNRFEAARVQT